MRVGQPNPITSKISGCGTDGNTRLDSAPYSVLSLSGSSILSREEWFKKTRPQQIPVNFENRLMEERSGPLTTSQLIPDQSVPA